MTHPIKMLSAYTNVPFKLFSSTRLSSGHTTSDTLLNKQFNYNSKGGSKFRDVNHNLFIQKKRAHNSETSTLTLSSQKEGS